MATEELHTLGELVRSEINVAGETLSRIDAQLQQLSSLFHNIDQLADYVAQVCFLPVRLQVIHWIGSKE